MRAPPPSLSTSVRTAGVPIRGPCLDREPRADYEIHRLGGNCLIVRCDPNPPRLFLSEPAYDGQDFGFFAT